MMVICFETNLNKLLDFLVHYPTENWSQSLAKTEMGSMWSRVGHFACSRLILGLFQETYSTESAILFSVRMMYFSDETCGRKQVWYLKSRTLAFSQRAWRKTTKSSVSVAGLSSENRTSTFQIWSMNVDYLYCNENPLYIPKGVW